MRSTVGKSLLASLLCLTSVVCLPTNIRQQVASTTEAGTTVTTTQTQEALPEVGKAVVSATERKDEGRVATAAENQKAEDDRLRRSPDHFFFQILDLDNGFRSLGREQDIPFETMDKFTPPELRSVEERRRKYARELADNKIETGAHAIFVLLDEPYFDEFDHAKAVLSLESRRKKERLPPHFLKSLRPFFPFFSKF
ncbi:uncharacterized protein [Palaemon carinicauda]|uniref:uncharacterized protein n=1 Tax=Palaemon carinicauda TaxID=392227 RepID=UPI0035B58CA9